MPNYAVNPNFTGYPGLTWPQSLEVYYAIQNGTPLPSYTPHDIVQQQEQRQRQQQHQRFNVYDGGRRMRYKSTRRRGKTNRRRAKTNRRRRRH
jgi:hypothetical protein